MTIEPIVVDDIKDILILEQELYVKPWQEKDFLYELQENPFAYYFKMVHENMIIGYIGFWITFEIVQITKVSIAKKYQGKGLATIFMQDMEQRVKTAHCQVISLEVRVSNIAAISLYKKCGFTIQSIRKNYYENHEDAYLMVKELKENDYISN